MNKELWYSSDIFAVTLTSDVVLKPLELACGENLERLGEALECYKQRLVGHYRKDRRADCPLECEQ